jgi:multiple sugar transport system ATP-binding protein
MMNLFTVPVTDGGLRFGEQLVPIPRDALAAADREVVFGVRPEHVQIVETGGLAVAVDVVEDLGAEAFVFGHARIHGRDESIVVRVDWRNPPAKGQTIQVRADEQHTHVFSTATGERLTT